MRNTIKICGIQPVYLDYLRQFDNLVSRDPAQNRKFVGALFEVNGSLYCAPMSSPKPKHVTMSSKAPDLFKIDEGRLGVINLNNMIPVLETAVLPIEIADEPDVRYRQLMNKQVLFLRANEEAIKKKAKRLYQIVTSGKQPKLNQRCCNYTLLEQASAQFGIVSSKTRREVAPTDSQTKK